MQQINLAIAICGGVVIALGLMSGAIKRSVLSVPLLALGVGIATGPVGLDLLRWQEWSDPHRIMKEAARLTKKAMTALEPLGHRAHHLRQIAAYLLDRDY